MNVGIAIVGEKTIICHYRRHSHRTCVVTFSHLLSLYSLSLSLLHPLTFFVSIPHCLLITLYITLIISFLVSSADTCAQAEFLELICNDGALVSCLTRTCRKNEVTPQKDEIVYDPDYTSTSGSWYLRSRVERWNGIGEKVILSIHMRYESKFINL